MDEDDERTLAIKEKQQKNLNILRELASKESNDEDESYVFGHMEDVPIGSVWATQSDCSKSGVHKPLLDCVHYGDIGACSLILENNPQDADQGDWFTYTGNSDPAEEVEVHPLSGSSLALTKNCVNGLPVRIVRRVELFSYSNQCTYRYDGLYLVRKYWRDVDILTEKKVFKFVFQRCKNQSPLPSLIDKKKTHLKAPHSRKIENTVHRKKPWKAKQNILLDFNKVKQESVEVHCKSTVVDKVHSYDDNESYKKLCEGDSSIYKECSINIHMLSHQYLYDKYSISINDFRKSNFNRHKREKTYSLSGFPLKRNYTSDCEVNKEHKITKLSRKIGSSSLSRNELLTNQTRNSVNLEKSKSLNHFTKNTYYSKSKLDVIPFCNQNYSEQMQLNIGLNDSESKRDLTHKYSSAKPKSANCSSELLDKNNVGSDSDSSDLLQLRISPPIITESVGSMPSDSEEELFAGFNSKCYFYKNKVIVELNDKVHVCNEHNYFVCDENDFSVLCEDDRETSFHDLENSEEEVYSL